MKYAIIDVKNGDSFEEIFETAEEALSRADYEWNHLSDYDKKKRESYVVAEVAVDEDGIVDFDNPCYKELKVYA